MLQVPTKITPVRSQGADRNTGIRAVSAFGSIPEVAEYSETILEVLAGEVEANRAAVGQHSIQMEDVSASIHLMIEELKKIQTTQANDKDGIKNFLKTLQHQGSS